MKLEAITTRKEKKDFIDVAFLLRIYNLTDLLSAHKVKYPYISTKVTKKDGATHRLKLR